MDIMKEELVRTLGKEKEKTFNKDFDNIIDKYKKKAIEMGYNGDLRFKKERGNIVILVVILPCSSEAEQSARCDK